MTLRHHSGATVSVTRSPANHVVPRSIGRPSGQRLTLSDLISGSPSRSRKCSACVAPGALWLFHNSCFSSSDGGSAAVRLLKIESSSDTRVLNNVLVAPNSGSHEAIDGTVAEAADNLATAEQLFAGQPITGGPQLDQLKLAAGASAAIDRATPLESVLYDLFGALRAGAPDIGAHER